MLNWARQNPYKAILIVLLIDAVLLALAFASGRYTVPERVVEKIVTQDVEKVVVKTEIQVVEKLVYVKAENRDVRRETTTVVRPDGGTETRVVETDRTRIDEASTQETDKREVQVVEKEKLVYVDKLTIIEKTPAQWHLGLRVGAGASITPGALPVPLMNLGLQAERRILGPVWMGIFADTQLNLLSPGTPPYGVVGGISVGLEL